MTAWPQRVRALGPGLWLALLLLAAAAALEWGLGAPGPAPARPLAHARRAAAPVLPNTWLLPEPAQARPRAEALLTLARQKGLQVQRLDSHLQRQAGADHLALTLQAQAPYAALRGFVEAVLVADPAASLKALRLQRDTSNAAGVQAELVWALHQGPGVAAVPASFAASAASVADAAPPRRSAWSRLDPFAPHGWQDELKPLPASVAAAARTAPAAAPASAAQPLTAPNPPYTLIGRFDDGERAVAWLANAQRTLAVRAGDLLDPQWRVDRVLPGRVELTWLPGNQRRSLTYPTS
jgi:hypothetical protein